MPETEKPKPKKRRLHKDVYRQNGGPKGPALDMSLDNIDLSNAVSNEERKVIRLQLGLQSRVNYPGCPAKSRSFVKDREKQGDYSHSPIEHQCAICSCGNKAGEGTSHLGSGWCCKHEKSQQRIGIAEEFAERHKLALQQRNPRLYHFEDSYFRKVEEEAEVAKENVNLRNELTLLRATAVELHDKIKTGKNENGKKTDLISHYTNEGIGIEMGDKEKAQAIINLVRAIAALAKTDYDITVAPRLITQDNFVIWLGKLARAVKDIKDENVQKTFVDVMKEVGIPRQGK